MFWKKKKKPVQLKDNSLIMGILGFVILAFLANYQNCAPSGSSTGTGLSLGSTSVTPGTTPPPTGTGGSLGVIVNPVQLTASVGQSVSFGVMISGGTPPYSVSWTVVGANVLFDPATCNQTPQPVPGSNPIVYSSSCIATPNGLATVSQPLINVTVRDATGASANFSISVSVTGGGSPSPTPSPTATPTPTPTPILSNCVPQVVAVTCHYRSCKYTQGYASFNFELDFSGTNGVAYTNGVSGVPDTLPNPNTILTYTGFNYDTALFSSSTIISCNNGTWTVNQATCSLSQSYCGGIIP